MITNMPRIAIAMHDYPAAVAMFRDVFAMPVADFSDQTVASLGAHVGMCQPAGGSNIELMAPADPSKPLSQALRKFLDARGEGFYALMLEAPDPNAEADALLARGVAVLPLMAGAGGRDIHPRSTSGVLVRVYPNDSVSPGPAYENSAPGLSGIMRVIVATADASLAAIAYQDGLGLQVGPVTTDDERGVRTATVRPPQGGVIELVSAVDTRQPFAAAIERDVKERSGGIHALVLCSDDPGRAAAVLAERGVTTSTSPAGATVFGARLLFEQAVARTAERVPRSHPEVEVAALQDPVERER